MATGANPSAVNRCGDERDEDHVKDQAPSQSPRATRQPACARYDCDFVERPPKPFQCECPVCMLVLREPHQVTCCGYSFCETCIKRVQENKKGCPTCNKAEFTVFPNIGLRRSLNEYRVYCTQREAGCDWVGELGELDKHLNLQPPPQKLLVGCQFSEVECTHCFLPFQRRSLKAHQSDDCPKRPYACQHCNKYATTFEDVTRKHQPMCPFFPLSCPNNCELVLQRQEVEHHKSKNCPLTLVQCDFHMVGCQIQLTRRDMPSHISENLTGHMSLLKAHIMDHPGENMATYLCLMVGSIQSVGVHNVSICSELQEAQESLRETHDGLQESCDQLKVTQDELQETRKTVAQLETTIASQNEMITTYAKELQASQERVAELEALGISQQEKNETLEQAIDVSREESATLHQSLAQQKHKLTENLIAVKDDLTRKITASEQKIQMQDVALNQHQKTLEKVTCTGTLPFEFTMTEFEQHKRASDEWYSPPFYTHTHGYRMCIKVQANGTESGKGTHLSAYGYLMRGDFDDDLQWPFQGAITIQLLNQLEDDSHRMCTINFTGTTDPCIISRVIGGERAESGWCNHTFISHAKLVLNTDKNCQYLNDGRLKFRVSKATNLNPIAHIHRRCLALQSVVEVIDRNIPTDFKLSGFEGQKKQDDVWFSPAFYTHSGGYRMCLKVYPNGNGNGLGTHVSIYMCILQGPNDGSLRWPLRGEITIQIVNETGDIQHEETVCYTDQVPENRSTKVTGRERALGWGKDRFLPHSSLCDDAAKKTPFLRGDTLRIRISKFEQKN